MSEQKLKQIYYDAETGYGGAAKLYRAARSHGFTKKQVKAFLAKQDLSQIFKKQGQKNYFPIASNEDGSYFIDLIFYGKTAAINEGNSGGPVIAGSRVIGVVMQGIPSAQSIG